jgi:integrase
MTRQAFATGALLLTGFVGGLRRSELVALDVEDICITKEGTVLRIRVSKVDQDGQGSDIRIAQKTRPTPVLSSAIPPGGDRTVITDFAR